MNNTTKNQEEFTSLLAQHNVFYTTSSHWISAGATPSFNNKWILMLSASVEGAHQLLQRVLPLLASWNLSFRITKSLIVLEAINMGRLGDSEKGRFITIYTRSTEEATLLADKLRRITDLSNGPVIYSGLKLGDALYASHATINNRKVSFGIPHHSKIPFKAGAYLVKGSDDIGYWNQHLWETSPPVNTLAQ